MDTGTIILVTVILIGLLLIVALRMRHFRDTSSAQPKDYSLTPSSFHTASTISNPDEDIRQVALHLLSQGQKLEAIKRVRQASGWDLKAAKDYVEAIEAGAVPPTPSMPTLVGSVSPELRDSLLDLVNNRRKIEAIKVLRDHTGLGLKEAKDYVEALGAGATPSGSLRADAAESVPEEVRSTVIEMLNNRRKIEAIKLVREATGWGLKEAKDFVDTIESGADRFDL
ncbi:MAG: ribosomal protein L7/L12 [Anaerolineae bacterium]|nr:ribosomal protein L7/L12 [Anaerolineae bacterium]